MATSNSKKKKDNNEGKSESKKVKIALDYENIANYDFGVQFEDDFGANPRKQICGIDRKVFRFLAYQFYTLNKYGKHKETKSLLKDLNKNKDTLESKAKIVAVVTHPDSKSQVKKIYDKVFSSSFKTGDAMNSVKTSLTGKGAKNRIRGLIDYDIEHLINSESESPSFQQALTVLDKIRKTVNAKAPYFSNLCLMSAFALAIYEYVIDDKSEAYKSMLNTLGYTAQEIRKALNTYFTQYVDSAKDITLIDAIDMYHKVGNFIPCPKGFNTSRSAITNDYWDLTLLWMCDTHAWMNGDDDYSRVLPVDFIRKNYLDMYYKWDKTNTTPLDIVPLFKNEDDGQLKANDRPSTREDYLRFFASMHLMIDERNNQIADYMKKHDITIQL